MKRYVVIKAGLANGDHEVHESSCYKLPSYQQQQDLGYHFRCADALESAKKFYAQVNGCYHCSRICHTEIV